MNISILKTTIHLPLPPSKLVHRPGLMQRLNEGFASGREITLVSAPAGYGKTTCISEWIQSLDIPAAWLSLSPSDNDPLRFFSYLIAALQGVDPDLGREIEAVIRAGQLPPSDVFSASMINDILELNTKFVLVLDDFHTIQDNNILDVLQKCLENHPWPLHLVFITREDPPLPFARLRANNKLTEIRAKELQFSREDIKVFLDEVMGVPLIEKDVALLGEKTEGWIAGLQLAGLAMRDERNPSEFISKLSGSHQFILHYFTEQVLSQQSKEVREFLFKTAVLDKFNSSLCNAITERFDSQDVLEQLYNANLFLVPLDDEHQWYRYHHFFADLLRGTQKQSGGGDLADTHTRASQWYGDAGMPGEAVHHALAAEDYPMAVALLEKNASNMLMQGYAKTVADWVQAVPDEWRTKCPKTKLAFAWVHILRGAYSDLPRYLDGVEPPADGVNNSNTRAEWLVMKSLVLYMRGEIDACMDLASEALEIVPKQENRILGLAYYVQAHVQSIRGDFPKAELLFKKSIGHSRRANSLVPEIMSLISLVNAKFERGEMHQSFELVSQAVDRLENSDELPPISAFIYMALGEIHYQWNQIEAAHQATDRAFKLCNLGGLTVGLISCRIDLSRLFQLKGEMDAAAKEVQHAYDLLPLEAPEYTRQYVAGQQVRVHLDLNQPDLAASALQSCGFDFNELLSSSAFFNDQSNPSSLGTVYNSFLRILLYQEDDPNRLRNGLDLVTRIILEAERLNQFLVALEALLLRSQFHAKLGSRQASTDDLIMALKRGQPQGILGSFLEQGPAFELLLKNLVGGSELQPVEKEYLKTILAAFDQPVKAASGEGLLIEPLTDRELDVLLLVAEGLKYKEIADKLFVSVNTVRYHVKAIYGKLGVNNRTQAIEKARKYQIL